MANQPDSTSSAKDLSAAAVMEVWTIAWPTILTMTSYTVMQFVDKLMVAQIGPLEVAAQGNGGIWSFTPIAFCFGLLTVVNTFVSQNFGAGRHDEGAKYAWAAAWMSLIIWLFLLVPWGLALPFIFNLLHDAATIPEADRLVQMESSYGQILIAGSVVLLMGRGLHHYFFGMQRPKVVTVSALVGNITNISANYVLIFGEEGLPSLGLPGVPGVPAMGIYGAAIGTVIGTALELLIPALIFLGPRMNRDVRSRAPWRPRLKPMRDLLRIGWPASVQFGNELACWSIFMTVLVGRFGADHMTAGWAALGYMHLSFMPAVGCSVAVTSLVGKYIGAGQPDRAVARARLGTGLAMIYMTSCAVAFFIFRYPMIDLFVGGQDVDAAQRADIVSIGAKLMVCAALFQTIDAFGITYNGALRGAGDTVWPGVVTIIYSWLFIVLGGWLMTQWWPQLESVGPWIAAAVYIVVFGITMVWRFERGRWRSIQLLEPTRQEAAEVAPIGPSLPPSQADAAIRDIAEELGDLGRRQERP
jgi:MATE family multidrug resistance protein